MNFSRVPPVYNYYYVRLYVIRGSMQIYAYAREFITIGLGLVRYRSIHYTIPERIISIYFVNTREISQRLREIRSIDR